MADLILHHSALALATEAPLEQDNPWYAGIPNWAGYASGIGIGIGFDIGASGISPDQLQKIMSMIGVEQWAIDELKKVCNKQFHADNPEEVIAAKKWVQYLKDDKKIKLSAQQCLDFLELTKLVHDQAIMSYFPNAYPKLHDAIKEVYSKVHYGNNIICKVAGQHYDQKLAGSTSLIQQCDICIESLQYLIESYG